MSTHMPGFQSFFEGSLHHSVLAKLATSSIRVKTQSQQLGDTGSIRFKMN